MGNLVFILVYFHIPYHELVLLRQLTKHILYLSMVGRRMKKLKRLDQWCCLLEWRLHLMKYWRLLGVIVKVSIIDTTLSEISPAFYHSFVLFTNFLVSEPWAHGDFVHIRIFVILYRICMLYDYYTHKKRVTNMVLKGLNAMLQSQI